MCSIRFAAVHFDLIFLLTPCLEQMFDDKKEEARADSAQACYLIDQEMIVLVQARQISRELSTCHRQGRSGTGW